MVHKAIVLVLLLIFSCGQCASVNYHDRRVYYGQGDNVCIGGAYDRVSLTISFDDRSTVQSTIVAGTVCNQYSLTYYNRISPLDYTVYESFYDQYYDQLIINQQYITKGFFREIVMRSTVRNPAKFDQNHYECLIKGDEAVQHYGPVGTVPAPSMDIYCKRIKSNLQTEQS